MPMKRFSRYLVVLLIAGLGLCSLAGCPRPRAGGGGHPHRAILPPPLPAWPAVALTSSERFKDGVQVFRAMDRQAKGRRAMRQSLVRYLQGRLRVQLRRGVGQEGFKRFLELVSLYRADLQAGILQSTDRGVLVPACHLVRKTFASRGGAEEVMTAVAVLESVDPGRRQRWRRELGAITSWLGDLQDPGGAVQRLVDASDTLNKVMRRWPSQYVRGAYGRLITIQYAQLLPLRFLRGSPTQKNRQALAAVIEFGWQRLRMLLLNRDEEGLRRFLPTLRQASYKDPYLIALIRRALSPGATPAAWIALAEALLPRWPLAAKAVCQLGARRRPKAANLRYCLGRLALQRRHTLVAIRHFDAAIRRRPDHREAWQRLASSYLDRLIHLLAQERLAQVRREISYMERLHRAAARRWPGRPLRVSLADVYFLLARGLFNEGRIDEAVATLRRANQIKPIPQALMQEGEIAFWRGRYRKAVQRFKAVYHHLKRATLWRAYWELKTSPVIALSHQRLAEKLQAQARRPGSKEQRDRLERRARTERAAAFLVRTRAVRLGRILLQNLRQPGLSSEVIVQVGRLLYQLGRRRLALTALATALDRAPNRSSTYVDVISFLVMRGHFDDALDAYHRALARDEVSEYLKAYCTFWILDLGRRAGVNPDRLSLAEVFLKHLKGNRWYHHLARFARGLSSYQTLAARARTKGQRAELDFYQSMRLLRQGKKTAARQLWQRIVASEMMAFFEYKMVRWYLRYGAPVRPRPKSP